MHSKKCKLKHYKQICFIHSSCRRSFWAWDTGIKREQACRYVEEELPGERTASAQVLRWKHSRYCPGRTRKLMCWSWLNEVRRGMKWVKKVAGGADGVGLLDDCNGFGFYSGWDKNSLHAFDHKRDVMWFAL